VKIIYCISGLGADERAFSRLQFAGYQFVFLPWLTPLPAESITDYASRMRKDITTENPILMGLSFGGMMSIEIAKQLPVEKIILISSIKSDKELPQWMKVAGALQLNKLLPMRSFKLTEPIQNKMLGIRTAEEIELVRSYRRNAPQVYMNWAINQVLNWRNSWQHPNLFHVHGDADNIFPIQNVAPTHIINGGGHFMIMNKAVEVVAAVQNILAK